MMSAPAPYPAVNSSAPAPDDHQISTKTPSICVDYLSHNWTDEDVWSSWKAMTKRKNEIANGVRLENASWRTWAKQRGKLKTISPETLNWLKDSDVTWLYGPLHEHADPVPPPKLATTQDKLGLDTGVKKSILKHRTISEMLGTSAKATGEGQGSASQSREGSDDEDDEAAASTSARPGFFPVRSDTNLVRRKKTGGSPPATVRVLAEPALQRHASVPVAPTEGRHISFNQRVDQCIAVDIPDDYDDDDEDEDDDDYSDDGYRRGSHFDEGNSSDEEMLTMKSSPRTSPSWPMTSTSSIGSSRGTSPSSEHQTIAKLAPTMLKTSEAFPAPSPAVVDPTGIGSSVGGSAHVSAQPNGQYDATHGDSNATRYSQWDADDELHGEFDYFNGPDVNDQYEEPAAREVPAATTAETSDVPSKAVPRSILKRRPYVEDAAVPAEAEMGEYGAETTATSPADPRSSSFSPSSDEAARSSPPTERGRSAQRLGSSASYERLGEAASRGYYGSSASASGSRQRSSSNQSNTSSGSPSVSPSSSFEPQQHGRPTERRESFRGRAGEGAKAMGAAPASASSSHLTVDHGEGDESDGAGSYDFASPGYPASPQLGDKEAMSGDDARMYGRKGDPSKWADDAPASPRVGSGKSRAAGSSRLPKTPPQDAPASGQRLSVDLENLPSNDPTAVTPQALGGPTPLNTPTFALVASRSKRGSGQAGEGKEPLSPTIPKRTAATGALVAPSGADREAGVRVPLAHDYVEEDEGGIVGRAVELVNTARDLIGAFWGRDKGQRWREG